MGKVTAFMVLFILFITYTFLIYTEGTKVIGASVSDSAIKGKFLFQKYNCVACHQLYGLGGYLGPELTTVMSEHGKGELYVKAFLQSGTRRMPDFHLSKTEINELAEYLKYVDATAITYRNRN